MRIGIFTDSPVPYINGVSTSIMMLKDALEKNGHQVFMVTVNLDDRSYKYENNGKIIRVPGIPTGIYDYRLTAIYPIRLIKKILNWNLDVIHSQTEFGIGTFARIFSKEFHIPLVHTYHTMYEDYVHYITKGHFNKLGVKAAEYFTKFYCDTTVSELIVPTKKAYNLFKEKYKVDRDVYIIPTGIDIERFYKENYTKKEINNLKEKLNLNKDDFLVLFVGRLGREKNIDYIIDVFKSLTKKHKNAKLLIVGDGPDAEEFKKHTKKLKLENNIIFTGKVDYPMMPLYYNMANAFITASVTETQGLTVIEAMAASLPVICINDESFNTTVTNDLNGYLFDNKKQCQKYLEKIIEDKKLLKRLSKGARNSASMHSSKYFAEQVLDIYIKAIKNKKPTFKDKLNNLKKRVTLWKK